MDKHECTIGLYYENDYDKLITLSELKTEILCACEYNENLRSEFYFSSIPDWMFKTEYSLSDYGDKRKSTNLKRFDYCPVCGKKIDWNKIKHLDDD